MEVDWASLGINPIALAMALPLLAAVLTQILGRIASDNVRDSSIVVMGLATFGTVLTILPMVNARESVTWAVTVVRPGLPIAFNVEPLGMLFAMVASGLWILTSIYGFGYMRGHHEENQTRFFTCFGIAIFAALGIAFAANLFTLFIFYEVLTFSTIPLVAHHQDEKALGGMRTYMGVLLTTSVGGLLPAIIWTWHLAGTTDFVQGGILYGTAASPWQLAVLLGLFAFGTGKAALMPFHKWLPAAMVAPTPVSALLHAVAVVKAGVFTVMKVCIYTFGIDLLALGISHWLCWVAAFTLMYTSIAALTKDNLKKRLAYSTISQLSYIVLGAALATSSSVVGGSMHIAMHAMGKITLFFCAGAIMVAHHKTDISDMDGIGHKMPVTMTAFFIASLSIIGLPPMGGSWGKWYLALGAYEADQLVFVAVLMCSSLLSIGYLMPVVGRAFFVPSNDQNQGIEEAPLLCLVPLSMTAAGCIALFFLAPDLYAMLEPIGEVNR